MINSDTMIHHNGNALAFCTAGCIVVDDAQLHPHGRRLRTDGLFHNFGHSVRISKHIDNIHRLGDGIDGRVTLPPVDLLQSGIDRNDIVTL